LPPFTPFPLAPPCLAPPCLARPVLRIQFWDYDMLVSQNSNRSIHHACHLLDVVRCATRTEGPHVDPQYVR